MHDSCQRKLKHATRDILQVTLRVGKLAKNICLRFWEISCYHVSRLGSRGSVHVLVSLVPSILGNTPFHAIDDSVLLRLV